MAAKADLLRLLEDTSRSQDAVLEEVLGTARRRKMSTEAVLRVCADLGATLPSPDRPQTVEEAVTSLVRHAFSKPERPHQAEEDEEAHQQGEDEVRTVSTNDIGTLHTLVATIGELSQAVLELKSEITDLKTMFTLERAEARDREQRQKNKITNLEKIIATHFESVDKTSDGTSSMLKSLDAKITNITNEQKKISPRAPSNSTSLSPSNHAHIPAIQRLGIDSDSTTAGPQRTYADSLAAPNTVHVPSSRSAKVLSMSDDRDTLRKVLQSPPTRAQAGAERPHTSVSTGQPGAVNHPRRGVQPLESDDEDDLWTLVSKAKPTGKKAAIYVGNLDDTAGEEKLREYINRRSRKAGIKPPKVHSCSVLRREEGELGSWGAHIVIDLQSLDIICNANFWPGRIYARPWVFRQKTAPEPKPTDRET